MPLNSKDENVYAIFFLLEQQYCHPNHVGVILWFFLRFLNPVSLCLFIASIGETEAAILAGDRKANQAIIQIKPPAASIQNMLGNT